MEKRKIIIDCDTGQDDAIALLVAHQVPNIEILGITTVSGNTDVDNATRNTLKVLHYLGQPYKVYRGMDRPVLRTQYLSSMGFDNVHGKNGLAGPDFDESVELHPEGSHAVDFIIRTLLNSEEKITLVATGPLTNIAMAIRLFPQIKAKIEEIVVMGGSATEGNCTPSAEFNTFADPEAAHIVFTCGVKVVMIGLHLTRQSTVYPERLEYIKSINNRGSKFFEDVIRVYMEGQKRCFGRDLTPIHDVVNIAYLADPTVFTTVNCNVEVCITPGVAYGRTVVDLNNTIKKPSPVHVAMELDKDKFWNILHTAISKYGK